MGLGAYNLQLCPPFGEICVCYFPGDIEAKDASVRPVVVLCRV
jgi:hypothetical protein